LRALSWRGQKLFLPGSNCRHRLIDCRAACQGLIHPEASTRGSLCLRIPCRSLRSRIVRSLGDRLPEVLSLAARGWTARRDQDGSSLTHARVVCYQTVRSQTTRCQTNQCQTNQCQTTRCQTTRCQRSRCRQQIQGLTIQGQRIRPCRTALQSRMTPSLVATSQILADSVHSRNLLLWSQMRRLAFLPRGHLQEQHLLRVKGSEMNQAAWQAKSVRAWTQTTRRQRQPCETSSCVRRPV